MCFRCNKILSIFHFHALFTAALLGQIVQEFFLLTSTDEPLAGCPLHAQDRIELVQTSSRGHDDAFCACYSMRFSAHSSDEVVPSKQRHSSLFLGNGSSLSKRPGYTDPLKNVQRQSSWKMARINSGNVHNGAEIHSRNAEFTGTDETESLHSCPYTQSTTPHASPA